MLYTIYTKVYILFIDKIIKKYTLHTAHYTIKKLHVSEKKNTTFDLLPLVFNRGPFEYYGRSL